MDDQGNILVVEGATVRKQVIDYLNQDGYMCDCVTETDAARDLLREQTHDVVVAGVGSKEGDDLTFVRRLSEWAPSTPVILITGDPSLEMARMCMKLRVHDYLVEPIDREELSSSIQRAVQRKQLRRYVRGLRQRAEQSVDDFMHIEQASGEPSLSSNDELLQATVDLTLENIAYACQDLQRLLDVLGTSGQTEALGARLQHDPHKQKLASAVREAISVLEETKKAFKSKQLANLRRHLEQTLSEVE